MGDGFGVFMVRVNGCGWWRGGSEGGEKEIKSSCPKEKETVVWYADGSGSMGCGGAELYSRYKIAEQIFTMMAR